jgi:dolichol-phosphate mannosyltransferase
MFKYTEVPEYSIQEFALQTKKYCVCVPIINEGDKIRKQLERMTAAGIHNYADIIICDDNKANDSPEIELLKKNNVSVLLIKKSSGRLSTELRAGYYYALTKRNYNGIVTIDGNNKDSVENIINIVKKLEEGYDFIQGSRFIPGGKAINTPLLRHIAIKLIHVPIISHIGGYKYTDTTNGFRGYSRKFLEDPRVEPFRAIFESYELIAYLSVRAPQLGYKVTEIPVTRSYPSKGKTPTKISPIKGNAKLLSILYNSYKHRYDPK